MDKTPCYKSALRYTLMVEVHIKCRIVVRGTQFLYQECNNCERPSQLDPPCCLVQ